MSDEVKRVAERILERTKDQIGTHSMDCHEYHLECFAAFVVRNMEAAQSDVVVESREALANLLAHAGTDWELAMSNGEKTQPLADHLTTELLASNTVRLESDVVREAKAEAWDEGAVYALERLSNGFDSVLMSHNPYSTEEESR